jgi:hypothetical protein
MSNVTLRLSRAAYRAADNGKGWQDRVAGWIRKAATHPRGEGYELERFVLFGLAIPVRVTSRTKHAFQVHHGDSIVVDEWVARAAIDWVFEDRVRLGQSVKAAVLLKDRSRSTGKAIELPSADRTEYEKIDVRLRRDQMDRMGSVFGFCSPSIAIGAVLDTAHEAEFSNRALSRIVRVPTIDIPRSLAELFRASVLGSLDIEAAANAVILREAGRGRRASVAGQRSITATVEVAVGAKLRKEPGVSSAYLRSALQDLRTRGRTLVPLPEREPDYQMAIGGDPEQIEFIRTRTQAFGVTHRRLVIAAVHRVRDPRWRLRLTTTSKNRTSVLTIRMPESEYRTIKSEVGLLGRNADVIQAANEICQDDDLLRALRPGLEPPIAEVETKVDGSLYAAVHDIAAECQMPVHRLAGHELTAHLAFAPELSSDEVHQAFIGARRKRSIPGTRQFLTAAVTAGPPLPQRPV